MYKDIEDMLSFVDIKSFFFSSIIILYLESIKGNTTRLRDFLWQTINLLQGLQGNFPSNSQALLISRHDFFM